MHKHQTESRCQWVETISKEHPDLQNGMGTDPLQCMIYNKKHWKEIYWWKNKDLGWLYWLFSDVVKLLSEFEVVKYKEMLEESVIPKLPLNNISKRLIFQQVNASCHSTKATVSYFNDPFSDVMNCPDLFSDINHIEKYLGNYRKTCAD